MVAHFFKSFVVDFFFDVECLNSQVSVLLRVPVHHLVGSLGRPCATVSKLLLFQNVKSTFLYGQQIFFTFDMGVLPYKAGNAVPVLKVNEAWQRVNFDFSNYEQVIFQAGFR